MEQHTYRVTLEWIDDDGVGTAEYGAYRRDHVLRTEFPR